MDSRQNIRILFFISKSRKDKNGYCPIYVRVTINGLRDQHQTGLKTSFKNWNTKLKRVNGNSKESLIINTKLKQLESEITKHYILLTVEGKPIAPPDLLKKIFPTKKIARQAETIPAFNLIKEFDLLATDCKAYFKELKRISKLKNEAAINYQTAQLDIVKERIKKEIEQLYKKSNNYYIQPSIKTNISIAVYEFLLQFLRKVMGGQRKYSTFRKWLVTKNKIQSFCWYHYDCSIFPLEKITYSFAQNFYDYLTLVDKGGNNLAMKHIKNAKQILDRAVNNGWLLNNPIHGFKCNYIDPEPEPVVMEDILKLINTDLGPQLNEYKDTFLFGIFTGFAYAELKDLKVDDIYTGIDGKQWIRNVRDKTQTKERVPLLPLPLQIIEKYNNHPCRIIEGKLLPVYSNQYYNNHLKIIAQKCNIGVDLTSHIARHTFATVITLENDVPLSTVSKMLGHKTTRTTERYARATQKKISKNMSRLQNHLFTADGQLKAVNE